MNRLRFRMMPAIVSILFIAAVYGRTFTLEQTIEMALQNNAQLLSQTQHVKAQGALIWEQISLDNPELFIEMEGIPKSSSSFARFEEKKIGIAQTVSMPWIYIMQGVRQNQQKKESRTAYLQIRNQVIADVKKQFYQSLLYQKEIMLYSELVDLNQEHLQKARIRVMAGEVSPYDTMKAKVDWMDARNQKLTAEQAYKVAIKKLGLLMGVDPSLDISITGQLSYLPVPIISDSLYAAAELKHPLIQKAFAELKQKRIERSMAWMRLIPDVHLKYFQQSFDGETSYSAWGGEVGIQFPLWFFTRNQGVIRHASHELKAEEIQYAAQRRKITLGIDKALAEMKLSEKQVNNYEMNALQEVNELVRIAQRSYEEGEMGSMEVSEALRSMIRVQIGYYESIFRYVCALADLEVAAGHRFQEYKK